MRTCSARSDAVDYGLGKERTRGAFLACLQEALKSGMALLPRRFVTLQAEHVKAAQKPDGGFAGRVGESDLYYSSFGFRAAELMALDAPELWSRAADFLRNRGPKARDMVECFSLLQSCEILRLLGYAPWSGTRAERVERELAALLSELRTPEGGYRARCGSPPSTYHTFLASLSYELLKIPMPCLDEAIAFISSMRNLDGGFAEAIQPGNTRESGVNPTAAAVVFLSQHGVLDVQTREKAAVFLLGMQRGEGGFAAHRNAPIPDLLSTFTALVALVEMGVARQARLAEIGRFVRKLALESGGFCGSEFERFPDVEYTFYGLATLALLAREAASFACERTKS